MCSLDGMNLCALRRREISDFMNQAKANNLVSCNRHVDIVLQGVPFGSGHTQMVAQNSFSTFVLDLSRLHKRAQERLAGGGRRIIGCAMNHERCTCAGLPSLGSQEGDCCD